MDLQKFLTAAFMKPTPKPHALKSITKHRKTSTKQLYSLIAQCKQLLSQIDDPLLLQELIKLIKILKARLASLDREEELQKLSEQWQLIYKQQITKA